MNPNGVLIRQATGCFASLAVTGKYPSSQEATEFSARRVTGLLLDLKDLGAALFLVALWLTFFYGRIAAVLALAAFALSTPMFLYVSTRPFPEADLPLRWVERCAQFCVGRIWVSGTGCAFGVCARPGKSPAPEFRSISLQFRIDDLH
jgi:hypothetical protein